MRRMGALLLACLSALGVPPARAADEGFEKQVDDAIDRGVAWLLERIEKDGWTPQNPLGTTAIEIYALAKSDVSLDHPKMQEGLERITGRLPVGHTYSVALTLLALDAIVHQMETDQALLSGRGFVEVRPSKAIWERMKAASNWLVGKRHVGEGCWGYNGEKEWYDNSNSQFAVLGLGVAAKRGIPIPVEVWHEIADHFLTGQAPDGPAIAAKPVLRRDATGPGRRGRTDVAEKPDPRQFSPEGDAKARGWAYKEAKSGVTPSMSCAGLSSLLIAREYLARTPGACPPEKLKRIDQAIRDGYAWLISQKAAGAKGWNFYTLYSLEKVGDLGNVETFDDWDWYRTSAEFLLKVQLPDGRWGGEKDKDTGWYMPRVETALALLVLNRATDLLSFTRPLFLSGRSGSREVGGDLVYIPRLDAQVSARRIFRKLRFSPNKGVVRLAEDMVKAYPVEREGELVKPLLDLFESPYRGIQALAIDLLTRVTGIKSQTADAYADWQAKWTELSAILASKDAAAAPKLREYLKTIESLKLKMKVVDGLRVLRAKEAIGDLIDQLSADDADYRSRAYDAIAYLAAYVSNVSHPSFSARGPKAERDRQIEALRAWWEREGKGAK
ncbi:MAG: hypothetical protein JXP34_03055 [Planctomycetes bacterium]|nr:hypothetical protein [Planctomycetota bacterium]